MTDDHHPAVVHSSEMPDNGGTRWPGSDEILGTRAPLSRPLGLRRVGVHLDVLEPGQRSSKPHAERYEEECVFVLEGTPTAIVDGANVQTRPGSFAAFTPGDGPTHTFENRTDDDVRLLVIGERRDHGGIALDALIGMWTSADDARVNELVATTFAPDATYTIAGEGMFSPADALSRRPAAASTSVKRLSDAIGWEHAMLEWRGAGARGVAVLTLDVKMQNMIRSITEYIATDRT